MIGKLLGTAVVVALALAVGRSGDASTVTALASPAATPFACATTEPNGDIPPGAGNPAYIGGYGNAALWTNLWMWGEEGVILPPNDPHITDDGAFSGLKWAWWRYEPGTLSIDGRRLDAPAPPLEADIPDGYGDIGFQVTGITFPTTGCWEVTGRVGDASLTFVTRVDYTPFPAATPVAP